MEIEKSLSEVFDSLYSQNTEEKDGVIYHILHTNNNTDLLELFGDNESATWGKKTQATLIRKAKKGEEVITYCRDANNNRVEETRTIAKEGQYVFQNLNNPDDTYVPRDENIIQEYEGKNEVSNHFQPFIRKSKPSKLLVGIIKKPTKITVKQWGNAEQFLGVGSTLKLECNEEGDCYITGINNSGFEGIWSITDKEGNVIDKNSILSTIDSNADTVSQTITN